MEVSKRGEREREGEGGDLCPKCGGPTRYHPTDWQDELYLAAKELGIETSPPEPWYECPICDAWWKGD